MKLSILRPTILNCKRFVCLSVLAALNTLAVASNANPNDNIQIELRAKVVLQHENVSLGDLANITTTDLLTMQKLLGVYMGKAPHSGLEISVDRDSITRWLRVRLGYLPGAIRWSGASQVQVVLASQEIRSEQMISVATKELQSWLESRSERSELHVLPLSTKIVAPLGNLSFKARPLSERLDLQQRMSVWVEVWSAGRFVRVVPVNFEVRSFQNAWVAKRELMLGESLNEELMEHSEIDMAKTTSPLLDIRPADGEKYRSKGKLAKGEVIRVDRIERIPTVQRGTPATLYIKTGLVDMESPVEVLQDGKIGDMIRVKASTGSAAVLARVVAPGRLEIK